MQKGTRGVGKLCVCVFEGGDGYLKTGPQSPYRGRGREGNAELLLGWPIKGSFFIRAAKRV